MTDDRMELTLVLTGGRAGKTCTLGKHQFVDGRCLVSGQSRVVGSMLRYMARIYEAYPEGSPKLKEVTHGKTDADQGPGSGPADEVLGDVQSDGTPDETTADSSESDGGGGASSGHGSEGDGHEHARIQKALTQLDHSDDENWTQGGKPAVHVVSDLLKGSVSRADIDAAAPDFRREGG